MALLAPLPPAQSGIADYACAWAAALRADGVDVVTPVATGRERWPDAGDALWRDVDVVHAELGGGRAADFLLLEQLRALQPQLPLTATVHDPERLIWRDPAPGSVGRWSQRLPRPLPQVAALLGDRATLARERRLAHGLSHMVTLTGTGKQCLTERMGVDAGRVSVIAHGNGDIAAQPLPPLAPVRLLYFGFIYPGKGIEDLLQAVAQVRQQRPDAELTLTLAGGTAPDLTFGSRGDYLQSLRQRAQTLGISDLLQWQLDVSAEEIVPCIQAHHVMVLPYQESWRIALLGRMRGTSGALSWANACGRGVIASDARAFAEEVSHGNGEVFAQGNVGQLAARVMSVLDDPQRVAVWAQQASALGQQRRWEKVAAQFHSMFQRVLEASL